MGLVWAATHLLTRRPIALKMAKPESAADPALRKRFFREARAACSVRHPNILEIHDVIELEDGTPVMVMDLLQGESLGQRLDRQSVLHPREVAQIMLPVVSAVGTAHASGIVHRDLKPDNIFLAREADGSTVVKVLDFGIAKVFAIETNANTGGAAGLTGTGAMLGTPFYMAPEQIFGERDIDHRADIWALGIVLYECLSGRRPTEAENIGQILKIVTTDSLVPLEVAAPDVPPDLAQLVGRMLARDRNARPQSLDEVQATLGRYASIAVRSFGPPAISSLRPSVPGSAPPITGRAEQDSTPVRLGHEAVSGTATTMSSTGGRPASTRARAMRIALAGALGTAALGALGVLGVRAFPHPASSATATAPSVSDRPPPSGSAAVARAASSASVFMAGSSPPIAPSANPAARVDSEPAASLRSRPPKGPSLHPSSQPATIAPVGARPEAKATMPGGVVETPPF
jgi:serine/threonine protein kinase